ncbi:DUF1249 domain-containing protein [Glaciecola sp. 1036]|uniref:DUF1249 domain-containing protein n=1 Tax=Alteromonadaceae TaxID=72275 RepID=UPI003D064F2E
MKQRYVPHLPSILSICENNYMCMLKLLPDCDTEDLSYQFIINGALEYRIQILESTPYTSTLTMAQITSGTPAFLRPAMVIRMYHDAKVAEVLETQRVKRLKPVYEYPNLHMHQRNEKFMTNLFLAEWLKFCMDNNDKSIRQNQSSNTQN